MRTRVLCVALPCLLAPALALAAAPTLHVTKSITIQAPADKVWNQIHDFGALNTWHPAVESDKIVEGTDNHPGAVRLLTLKGGGTLHEKLLALDEHGHRMSYAIVDGVLPVSHYRSTIRVSSLGAHASKVTWTGSFQRKDTGPHPAADANDKTAVDTIDGVYQSGIDNLKKIVEAR